MITLRAGGRELRAAAFVFDKDGLMFESQRFWQELSEERLRRFARTEDTSFAALWAEVFGVSLDRAGRAVWIDPKGILAVASPAEEIAVTAGLIVQRRGISWDQARDIAAAAFRTADRELDLTRALRPRKGFPDILARLRARGVPYAIATSDTRERAIASLTLFDDPGGPAFILTPADVDRGKPHPDMLLEAAARFGVSPEELVMVGDSYVDVEMAARAGAAGIGIPETDEMRQRILSTGAVAADDLDGIVLL